MKGVHNRPQIDNSTDVFLVRIHVKVSCTVVIDRHIPVITKGKGQGCIEKAVFCLSQAQELTGTR